MVGKHSIVGFEHYCLERWLFVAMSVNQLMAIDAVFAQLKNQQRVCHKDANLGVIW